MRLLYLALACLLAGGLAVLTAGETVAGSGLEYVRAGKLFNSRSGQSVEGSILVIDSNRIRSVESSTFALPAGARVIELSRSYVLPGLIDCHTHLTARADRYEEINFFKDTPFTAAINGVVNAKKTLEAGFTTVRDVGSLPFAAVDLRTNIDAGFIPGPRIVASGPAISHYRRTWRSE